MTSYRLQPRPFYYCSSCCDSVSDKNDADSPHIYYYIVPGCGFWSAHSIYHASCDDIQALYIGRSHFSFSHVEDLSATLTFNDDDTLYHICLTYAVRDVPSTLGDVLQAFFSNLHLNKEVDDGLFPDYSI